MSWLLDWFDTSKYVRRGYCGEWSTELFWNVTSSDMLIGLGFFGVSIMIFLVLHKRKDIPVWALGFLLAMTTFFCGISHFTAVLMSVWPAQWVDALARDATAVLCIATLVAFFLSLRRIIKLVTPLLTEQSGLTDDVSVLVEDLDKHRETINEKTRACLAQVRDRLAKIGAIRKELNQVEDVSGGSANHVSTG